MLATWLTVAALTLAGCGQSGDTTVERAQAKVAAKQKAVTKAQAALSEASKAFCASSKTYIVALDRYGDVLDATATTVGDVKTAGADLAAPREDALAKAQDVSTAREDLATAEKELADAEAALKKAKATASPSEGSSASPKATNSPTSTPVPTPSAATVDRVTRAESDLAAAQGAITDSTPLAQASQQFNAAAVALEMAWLQLFSDAGCLGEDTKQAEDAVREYTIALQQALADVGYYDGEIDGVYGPDTVDAVEELQKANGLPVTGALDKATAAALDAERLAKGGAAAQQALTQTAAVQQTLKLAGFWDGPVDGTWTPALTEAVKEFQTALDVEPTGNVDAATIRAVEKALAEAGQSGTPTPGPSPTASSTPTATSSPTGQ